MFALYKPSTPPPSNTRYGYVLAASDWIGLAEYDEPFVADMMVSNLTDFRMVADRCTQGVINALMLMRMLKGPSG